MVLERNEFGDSATTGWRYTKDENPPCEDRQTTRCGVSGPACVFDPVLMTDDNKLFIGYATKIGDRHYWWVQHPDSRMETVNAKGIIEWRELDDSFRFVPSEPEAIRSVVH